MGGIRTEILVWADFNQDTIERLRTCDNVEEKRHILADTLNIDKNENKSAILLDAFQGKLKIYSKSQ